MNITMEADHYNIYNDKIGSTDINTPVLGLKLELGIEKSIANNMKVFGELNYDTSLTKAKKDGFEVKAKSTAVKLGARYYF